MKYMLNALLLSIFLMFGTSVIKAQLFEVETTDGNFRNMMLLKYPVNNSQSANTLVLSAGDGALESSAELISWSLNYTAVAGYAGNSGFTNRHNGLVFRATDPGGRIRFLTGGVDVAVNNRMTIAANGNIGVGIDTPNSRLQLASGDVYLQGSGSGVIMKSPNGDCWRLTVSNSGTSVFSSITCP